VRVAAIVLLLLAACAGSRPVPTVSDRAGPRPGAHAAAGERGLASYYADALAGRRTASGEVYRPDEATCAHRRHAFGTRLRITAVASGRSAMCRVNDRGPFVKGRILDVSRSVAERLGVLQAGVFQVEIREPE
jgi:rare lipoprotein A